MDILIVDDEPSIRLTTSVTIESEGHYVETAEDGDCALKRLKEENFDVVFLDLRLGDENGLEILAKILEKKPRQLVVIFTAHASIKTAVSATQAGAFDYLEKPFTPDQVRAILAKAEKALRTIGEVSQLEEKVRDLKTEVDQAGPPLQFNPSDNKSKQEFEMLFRAAESNASILILGESGTGKSVIAKEVHQRSHLRNKPFVTVSCPSLSKELLESTLFGHVKGSFTGAVKDTWGKVHAAEGGTLFLDEIGELPIEIQPKLLRLLQEREYERVGENKIRTSNVRIIAATNRDLTESIAEGSFREDLYYRLNVISVTMPPLRERKTDLVAFANTFLNHFAGQMGRKIEGFSPEAEDVVRRHAWPGNLRELRNAIERAAILAKSKFIEPEDLPQPSSAPSLQKQDGADVPGVGGQFSLEELELAHMREVIGWAPSLSEAARILGINKATLYRKRKQFGIS